MKSESEARRGSTLTGNAGEYYVMAELLKRGIVAALAPRKARKYRLTAGQCSMPEFLPGG